MISDQNNFVLILHFFLSGLNMSATNVSHQKCPLCKKDIEEQDEVVRIREKGDNGINAASVKRGDSIFVTAGCEVHSECRKRYTNPLDIMNSLKKNKGKPSHKRSARASTGPFNSKSDCLFCGNEITFGTSVFSCVKTDTFVQTILQCCSARSDEWAFTMKGRIEFYGCDLHVRSYKFMFLF